jgi:Fe-S cluster biosynthesis and repair protein YggX
MTQINCVRCGKGGEQLGQPPLPTDLGHRIFDSICQECWGEWLKHQTAVINHYGLNLVDPEARKFLTQQTEQFLFGPLDG